MNRMEWGQYFQNIYYFSTSGVFRKYVIFFITFSKTDLLKSEQQFLELCYQASSLGDYVSKFIDGN
jgi:hypothetical protein